MGIERPFPIGEKHRADGDEGFFELQGPQTDAERAVVDAVVEKIRNAKPGPNRRSRLPRSVTPAPKA